MLTTALDLDTLRASGLADVDPAIAGMLDAELSRQQHELELIASENFTWPAVLEAMGSVATNKYAEGYPGRRYYGGCVNVDQVETLAIERLKALFGAEHANVQPHSGASANLAVYGGLLSPGDTVLGLRLDQGGHLTHGHRVNFSGKLYHFVAYGVRESDERIDMDEVRTSRPRASPEDDRRRRLCLLAPVRLRRVPRDRRRGGRAVDGRHGPHRGPRRRGRASEPGSARARRDLDDPQDPRTARVEG